LVEIDFDDCCALGTIIFPGQLQKLDSLSVENDTSLSETTQAEIRRLQEEIAKRDAETSNLDSGDSCDTTINDGGDDSTWNNPELSDDDLDAINDAQEPGDDDLTWDDSEFIDGDLELGDDDDSDTGATAPIGDFPDDLSEEFDGE
jgi:hypothetical protein